MSDVAEAPKCTVGYRNDNVDTSTKAVPCGLPMVRAGSVTNWFHICPRCDVHIPVEKYLDQT